MSKTGGLNILSLSFPSSNTFLLMLYGSELEATLNRGPLTFNLGKHPSACRCVYSQANAAE